MVRQLRLIIYYPELRKEIGAWGFEREEDNSQEDWKSCLVISCLLCHAAKSLDEKVISGNSSLSGRVSLYKFFWIFTSSKFAGTWLSSVQNNPMAKVAHSGVPLSNLPQSHTQIKKQNIRFAWEYYQHFPKTFTVRHPQVSCILISNSIDWFFRCIYIVWMKSYSMYSYVWLLFLNIIFVGFIHTFMGSCTSFINAAK